MCMHICLWYSFLLCVTKKKHSVIFFISECREETEIIEGEVVEIQIDRPATGTVSKTVIFLLFYSPALLLLFTRVTYELLFVFHFFFFI